LLDRGLAYAAQFALNREILFVRAK